MTHSLLAFLASSVNPVVLLVFIACVIARFPVRSDSIPVLTRCGAALLVTYLFAHINRWMHLWKDHSSFPSGHMTFYIAIATSFFLLNRRSALITAPLALLYGWLIVFLDFHSWLDLWGAFFLSVPLTLLCHRKLAERSAKDQATQ